jgi:hypothetical protein
MGHSRAKSRGSGSRALRAAHHQPGNSGSQATSLIIRSLALGEIKPRLVESCPRAPIRADAGLILDCSSCRILVWQHRHRQLSASNLVAPHDRRRLVGVVAHGSLAGSMLPFVLQKLDSTRLARPLLRHDARRRYGLSIYSTSRCSFFAGRCSRVRIRAPVGRPGSPPRLRRLVGAPNSARSLRSPRVSSSRSLCKRPRTPPPALSGISRERVTTSGRAT